MPTVGAAVGLVVAGSWTGSGNEVGEKQSRPEDEAAHTCEPPANEQRAWCETPSRRARSVGGSLRAGSRLAPLESQERDRTRERGDSHGRGGIEVETDGADDGPRRARVAPHVVEELALGLLLCQAAGGRGEAPAADMKMAARVGHQVEEPLGAFSEPGTHNAGPNGVVAPYHLEHGIARPPRAAPAMLEQEEARAEQPPEPEAIECDREAVESEGQTAGLARVRHGELQEVDATYPVCGFESTCGNPAARLGNAAGLPSRAGRPLCGSPYGWRPHRDLDA